jgi:hypothetical protein
MKDKYKKFFVVISDSLSLVALVDTQFDVPCSLDNTVEHFDIADDSHIDDQVDNIFGYYGHTKPIQSI